MEWSSFPAREEPKKGIIVLIFIIFLSIMIALLWGLVFGIMGILLLGLSLLPFCTPTYYKLDEEEIIVKKVFYTIKKKWGDYRSYYVDNYGVLLSPFKQPTRLENYRGLYLRFNNNKDEVIEFIKKKLSK